MPPHAEFSAIKPGIIYCLKQRIDAAGNEAVNPLQPYFLVYIRDDGEVRYNFTAPKQILEIFRTVCQGQTEPHAKLCKLFDEETAHGQDMSRYSGLLDKAIAAIAAQFGRKNAGNLFSGRGGKLADAAKQIKKSNDFDLITWLVIRTLTMADNSALRQSIQDALQSFSTQSLATGAIALLHTLGYSSDKTAELGNTAEALLGSIEQFRPELGSINRAKVHANRWKSCAFLFQLTNDEIPSLALGQAPIGADGKLTQGQIESFVFLAIDLQGEGWSRSQLATIARELNKRFPMPAIFLFRQEELFSRGYRPAAEPARCQSRRHRQPHHRHQGCAPYRTSPCAHRHPGKPRLGESGRQAPPRQLPRTV